MSSKEILHDVMIEEDKNNKNIDDKIYEAFKKTQNDLIEILIYRLILPMILGLNSIAIGIWIVVFRPGNTPGIFAYTIYILSFFLSILYAGRCVIWTIYLGKEIIKHDN